MDKNDSIVFLFTDASADPTTNIGFGAYLLTNGHMLYSEDLSKEDVKIKKFENTNSSKLELQTILWALNSIKSIDSKILVFTDCQNIISLKSRRERLEKHDYRAKNNTYLRNHELYREFFRLNDILDCDFVKIKGHMKSDEKNILDKTFTLVDRASRDALREYLNK